MKAFLSILLLLTASLAHADPFVVIVRHAEKGTNNDKDPDLSPIGFARAEVLQGMLKNSDLKAVFATEFRRTQQTAIIGSGDIRPTIVPASAIDELVSKLRALNGNALVVGHGNTIPNLIKALGIDSPVNITENDYSQIFIVALGAKPQLLRMSYPGDRILFNSNSVPTQSSSPSK